MSETWLSFSGVGTSVASSDTVLAGSSTILVSIFISWLRRRLRLLLPLPPLRGRCSSGGESFDSVDAVTSDASAFGGKSLVDTDSLDFRLRREDVSTNGSGVPSSQASSLVSKPLVGGVAGAAGSGGGDTRL